MTYQEIRQAIEHLPAQEWDSLLELIRQQQIEQRRAEITTNREQFGQSIKTGTIRGAKNVEALKLDLLVDSESRNMLRISAEKVECLNFHILSILVIFHQFLLLISTSEI